MVRCAFVIPVLIASRGGTCIVWYCNAIPFTPPRRCHSIVIRSFQLSAPSKSGCCCVNLQKRSSKWTSNLYRYTAISILEAVCHLPNHTDRLDACWQNGRRRRFNCEWRGGGPSWIIERGETHWPSGEILTHLMILMGQFMSANTPA